MFLWLVTVRAAEGRTPAVRRLLDGRLLPLLRAQPGCSRPTLAARTNCAGEHSCLAFWSSRSAIEDFEAHPAYQTLMDELALLLRVPPKRALWAGRATPT
jgi:quinol monooxygenase YgiN